MLDFLLNFPLILVLSFKGIDVVKYTDTDHLWRFRGVITNINYITSLWLQRGAMCHFLKRKLMKATMFQKPCLLAQWQHMESWLIHRQVLKMLCLWQSHRNRHISTTRSHNGTSFKISHTCQKVHGAHAAQGALVHCQSHLDPHHVAPFQTAHDPDPAVHMTDSQNCPHNSCCWKKKRKQEPNLSTTTLLRSNNNNEDYKSG